MHFVEAAVVHRHLDVAAAATGQQAVYFMDIARHGANHYAADLQRAHALAQENGKQQQAAARSYAAMAKQSADTATTVLNRIRSEATSLVKNSGADIQAAMQMRKAVVQAAAHRLLAETCADPTRLRKLHAGTT